MPAYGQIDIHIIDALVGTSETTIPHGMTRVPVEAFIIQEDASGDISRGPTAWDSTNIYLVASVSTGVRLALI